ncbi:DUF3040 domain-containing protein [Arthrobacter sp. TmT3-37]
MALSDREQHVLDDIIRNLEHSDPRLAAELSSGYRLLWPARNRFLALGILMMCAGLAVVVASASVSLTFWGVMGFWLMCAGGNCVFPLVATTGHSSAAHSSGFDSVDS